VRGALLELDPELLEDVAEELLDGLLDRTVVARGVDARGAVARCVVDRGVEERTIEEDGVDLVRLVDDRTVELRGAVACGLLELLVVDRTVDEAGLFLVEEDSAPELLAVLELLVALVALEFCEVGPTSLLLVALRTAPLELVFELRVERTAGDDLPLLPRVAGRVAFTVELLGRVVATREGRLSSRLLLLTSGR